MTLLHAPMGWSRLGGRRIENGLGYRCQVGDPSTPVSGFEAVGIYLYWIPLGAGGVGFVRFNGRLYEVIKATLERRRPLDLYHTALVVNTPEGRFAIENAWPSPDANTASRGVVMEGPVFGRWIARIRPFRYEVRCWRDGVISDAGEAVGGAQRLSSDLRSAQQILDLVPSVPSMVWGRDELGVGEMWNSNSVISWLLTRGGIPADMTRPPVGWRAPGWRAGIALARREGTPPE